MVDYVCTYIIVQIQKDLSEERGGECIKMSQPLAVDDEHAGGLKSQLGRCLNSIIY